MKQWALTSMLASLLAAASGCSLLAERAQQAAIEEAQADHRTCAAQGHEYPSENYRKCRLRIADERQFDRWTELKMLERSRELASPNLYPPEREIYRPIDPARFECRQRTWEQELYIECRETDTD
ncbi:MAG TPA: hypothetical protein VNL72_00200 [Gammaproteobacteria bacterium]|nr:hypothetical protein [Gammaproteobacteria bacterium]